MSDPEAQGTAGSGTDQMGEHGTEGGKGPGNEPPEEEGCGFPQEQLGELRTAKADPLEEGDFSGV